MGKRKHCDDQIGARQTKRESSVPKWTERSGWTMAERGGLVVSSRRSLDARYCVAPSGLDSEPLVPALTTRSVLLPPPLSLDAFVIVQIDLHVARRSLRGFGACLLPAGRLGGTAAASMRRSSMPGRRRRGDHWASAVGIYGRSSVFSPLRDAVCRPASLHPTYFLLSHELLGVGHYGLLVAVLVEILGWWLGQLCAGFDANAAPRPTLIKKEREVKNKITANPAPTA